MQVPRWEFYNGDVCADNGRKLPIVRMTRPRLSGARTNILLLVEDFSYYQPTSGARVWNLNYRVIVADYDTGIWISRDEYATLKKASEMFDRIRRSNGFVELTPVEGVRA